MLNHQAMNNVSDFLRHICVALFAGSLFWSTASCIASEQSTLSKTNPTIAVKLAENGQALLPVVVAADATSQVLAAAQTLSKYLQRISGSEFKVETSAVPFTAGTKGIAVGVASQFGPVANALKTDAPTQREDYLLRSHSKGIFLVGSTETALQHAVWDFLYRLGYRQFFPGKKWEIVPSEKNLALAVDTLQHPDYYNRNVWVDFGSFPENSQQYQVWKERNRETEGINLNTGHSYQAIIRRNKAEFDKHPEYQTKPNSTKFCVSNPGLRQLVIDDALKQFEKNPSLQSISLDPSDGENWESDSCPDVTVYKSVTDRVVTLANAVAEAVEKNYPGKFVGIYAYNVHSPPPTIPVRPNVVVSIATSFIHGGFTVDQLVSGWSEKAKILGIRDYYSVNTWDRDLPGKATGGNPGYLKRTIPYFHQRGARFMNSQASDNWGPNGLGYYLASRMLWDVKEADHLEGLKADFLQKTFGAAREPMSGFYSLIDTGNKPLLSTDLIGRMYAQLDRAFRATNDPAVRARLYDLALYTRYVELYMAYSSTSGAERQAAFEQLMRFSWRIRDTMMVHTRGLWRDLVDRDKTVKFPEGSGLWAKDDPWKSDEPFNDAQVQQFIADGIANNPKVEFEALAFSQNLVPATALKLRSGKIGNFYQVRGDTDFYTWVEKSPATISLQTQAGLIYTNRGPATFSLYPKAETAGAAVVVQEVAPKQPQEIHLKTAFSGLHRLNVRDSGASTSLSWPAGTPMSVESTLQSPVHFAGGRWSLYFYVPKGTKVVGGYRAASIGEILDSDGKVVKVFSKPAVNEYWSVPVAPGQDGKLWMLNSVVGRLTLMTVPPYLARRADELLLPAEVVEADAAP